MKTKTLPSKPRLSVYRRVADVLKTRILHGDYSLKTLPSERVLAQEFGINFMTVRRSLRHLEAEGLLVRKENGRLNVPSGRGAERSHFTVAMLMPAGASLPVERCRMELEQAAGEYSATVRPVVYSHWNDPVLLESLSSFDGIFFYPFESNPPEAVIKRIQEASSPVLALDHDFSAFGIPSIQFFPPIYVNKLLDHLREQGHTCIGCLNTQSPNSEIRGRIDQWRFWSEIHGISGRLIDAPVEIHGSTGHQAHSVMSDLLVKDKGPETAWICVTMGAAVGLLRAMADLGLRAPNDLSVCAVNGADMADLLVPSVTALEQPRMVLFFKSALRWITSGKAKWQGPLLIQPPDADLVIRESTGPVHPLSKKKKRS